MDFSTHPKCILQYLLLKLDLESSNVVIAAAFNTLLRREVKFSADCFVNGVSATCCFRAIDQRSDVIELIANKEIFCGVQISINEAKNALSPAREKLHLVLQLVANKQDNCTILTPATRVLG